MKESFYLSRTALFLSIFAILSVFVSFFYFSVFYSSTLELNQWYKYFLAPIIFSFNTCEYLALASFVILLTFPNRYLTFLPYVLIIFITSIEVLQFFSLYYTNDLLTIEAVAHANLFGLLVNSFTIGVYVTFITLPLLAFYLYNRQVKIYLWSWSQRIKAFFFALVITTLVMVLNNNIDSIKLIKFSYQAGKTPPLTAFFNTLKSFFNYQSQTISPIELTFEDIKIAKQFGISIDPHNRYPLVKNSFYKHPLSRKSLSGVKPGIKPNIQPNIITIFGESLSTRLIGAYQKLYPNITPNIDRFAAKSLKVEGYFNHAFPTIIGLKGQLCSLHPYFLNTEWSRAKFKLKTSRLLCLPQILNSEGYNTFFMGYSHPNETYFQDQMQDFGFQKTYFYQQFLDRFVKGESPGRGRYGNSDRQMFQGLIEFLKSNNSDKPFYVGVSTIETHPGMDVKTKQRRYKQKDGKNNAILNVFHQFDYEFGLFWDYFVNSPYFENTIVILTADHAHVPSVEFQKVAGPQYRKDYFDTIPFIIYSPFHSLPSKLSVAGSSIDYAPTILHLLDVPNRANSFLGVSIFERDMTQGAIGMVKRSKLLVVYNSSDNSGSRNNKIKYDIFNYDHNSCQNIRSDSDVSCSLFKVIKYSHQLIKKNHVFRSSI